MAFDRPDEGAGSGQHRRPPGRLHAWRNLLLEDLIRSVRQARARLALAGATLGVLIAAVVSLVVVGGDAPRNGLTALPPTPPSPTAAPPSSPAASAPGRSKPLPGKAASRTPIRCGTAARTGTDAPERVCIPGLGVDAVVMSLGLNPDRTVQVPPLSRVGDAGWYRYSALPGDIGPTVILGHVDSAQYGEGVFYRLGQLHRGDTVRVSRGDGMVATYRIDNVEQVSKSRFPTQAVYGRTAKPSVRLVTCGGRFDAASGNYVDNIIAFGTLRSLQPS